MSRLQVKSWFNLVSKSKWEGLLSSLIVKRTSVKVVLEFLYSLCWLVFDSLLQARLFFGHFSHHDEGAVLINNDYCSWVRIYFKSAWWDWLRIWEFSQLNSCLQSKTGWCPLSLVVPLTVPSQHVMILSMQYLHIIIRRVSRHSPIGSMTFAWTRLAIHPSTSL